MLMIGPIGKMSTKLSATVEYSLPLADLSVNLNAVLGKKVSLRYLGKITCIQCGKQTKTSFQQGYCYVCYLRFQECNLCTIHPEKCRYYEGKCQPNDWAHAHCGQLHVVYLANSSGLKVGITRASSLHTRWMDQGASQGMAFFQVNNRHQAGLLEVIFKKHISDKTNWRQMLKVDADTQDLAGKSQQLLEQTHQERKLLTERFPDELIYQKQQEVVQIRYPIVQYPEKINSFNLDKEPRLEGYLQGIKGQYLLFDTGVISIRKYAGYHVELAIE